MGDGIGHVAVTGVALGLLTGTSPTWTAVVVAVLGAVAIEVIRERGSTNGDVALALLFYGGLAGGVLVTGLAGTGAAELAGLPLRLDHHHQRHRRGRHDGAGRDRGRDLRRPVAAAVRGRPGPGLRPGRRPASPRLQHPDRRARRGQRDRRDAHRRAAAGLRADGRARRDRPAADPVVPHDADRRDGARRGRVPRRAARPRRSRRPTPTSHPVRPSCCWPSPGSWSPGRSAPGCAAGSG